jgi:hypothetical protein
MKVASVGNDTLGKISNDKARAHDLSTDGIGSFDDYSRTIVHEDILLDHLLLDDGQLITHRNENVDARANQCQQTDDRSKTKPDETDGCQDDQCHIECAHLVVSERSSALVTVRMSIDVFTFNTDANTMTKRTSLYECNSANRQQ